VHGGVSLLLLIFVHFEIPSLAEGREDVYPPLVSLRYGR